MPKRLIDFEALWSSGKLSNCKPSHRVEYLWIYGLADAGGNFELTNLRAIWGQVSAIRPDLNMRKLKNALQDFESNGLLFVWRVKLKKFGHWVGSRQAGRLPPPSQRSRYYLVCPEPPSTLLIQYESGFRSSQQSSVNQAKDEDLDLDRMGRGLLLDLEGGPAAKTVTSAVENLEPQDPKRIGFKPEPKVAAEAERQKRELAQWQKDHLSKSS